MSSQSAAEIYSEWFSFKSEAETAAQRLRDKCYSTEIERASRPDFPENRHLCWLLRAFDGVAA